MEMYQVHCSVKYMLSLFYTTCLCWKYFYIYRIDCKITVLLVLGHAMAFICATNDFDDYIYADVDI